MDSDKAEFEIEKDRYFGRVFLRVSLFLFILAVVFLFIFIIVGATFFRSAYESFSAFEEVSCRVTSVNSKQVNTCSSSNSCFLITVNVRQKISEKIKPKIENK